MTSRLTQQATAFALAALVTFGVLSGLNGLAISEAATAGVAAQMSQAVSAQPA